MDNNINFFIATILYFKIKKDKNIHPLCAKLSQHGIERMSKSDKATQQPPTIIIGKGFDWKPFRNKNFRL
jgi:hypothetical protein